MPRAVVTGGAGFIGSHMVDLLLERGFEVVVIDNLMGGRVENLAQHRANSRVRFDVHARHVRRCPPTRRCSAARDYVFHFGGIGDIVPSIERPLDYMRANVNGTLAVLEAARHGRVAKFVYAASSSCYGLAAELPTTEDAPIRPEYPYALSKYLGECAALHWGQVYGLPVVSIRIFNVYGPRVRTTGAYGAVFGVFLAQKLHGKPFTVVGDGTQRRDFVYVTDVARAFSRPPSPPATGEVYNLGGGGQPPDRQPAGRADRRRRRARPQAPGRARLHVGRHRPRSSEHLGWEPSVSFRAGGGVHARATSRTGARRPLWTPEKIEAATRTWFQHLAR